MKKRLVVFHPALAPYRVDFFNGLNKAFETGFYFYHTNVPDQEFDQEKLIRQCHFRPRYLRQGFDYKGRSFRTGIIKVLKKHRPEIVICSEYSQITVWTFLYLSFFSKSTKLYILSDDSLDNAKERTGIRRFLRNFISKNSSGIIFPSREVGRWYQQHVSGKIKVMELPIIHSNIRLRKKYKESIDLANELIDQYSLENKIVLLFVGRLTAVKNLPFLLNCFSEIKNENLRLILVGSGDQEETIRSLVKKLNLQDTVILPGRKEGNELYAWYLFPQIFVFPSTYERFGAVVNEALLGGCFTLCSEAAGAATLITGQNGKTFDPFNKKDLITKLKKAIRTAPSLQKIHTLRPDAMPFTFKEKLSQLLKDLE